VQTDLNRSAIGNCALNCLRGPISILATLVALVGAAEGQATAQEAPVPPSITTPDKVETRVGTLEFNDGAPSVETAEKVYDTLDFTRGLNVFNNSFRGASAYAIRQGFLSIGAEDNTVVLFPDLMDAKSLFLTANADTVYYMAVVDLTKGPMVVEQPPKGLGTINDMWFRGSSTSASPAPIAARVASTCWCRRAMTARCRKAASTWRTRAPRGCSTPPARSSPTTTRSRRST
jgi:Protein of unknown function (DUF1254)